MPLGGLLPYESMQTTGLMAKPQGPQMNPLGANVDFNALARQMAGPMPALPQFDFSPINIAGSGGSSGVPNQGAINDMNPPSGGTPSGPNPATGMDPALNPPTVPNVDPNQMIGPGIDGSWNFTNPTPSSFDASFPNLDMQPFTPSGSTDWNSIGLGGALLGPMGLGLGYAFGDHADAPYMSADARYAGVDIDNSIDPLSSPLGDSLEYSAEDIEQVREGIESDATQPAEDRRGGSSGPQWLFGGPRMMASRGIWRR